MGHLSVSLPSDTWFANSDYKMAGAYRIFAVLIAELSLTLAQLPQELFSGYVPNVNLQLNAPPIPSGFPGHLKGYTEMSPVYPFSPSRFGFPAFSDPLIDRRLPPIPSSSITSVSLADNRLPVPENKNDIPDIPGSETIPDQSIPGVFSRPVQHPYLRNNLGFPSPFGIPYPLGLENPFVTPNIFDNQNTSNQPDVYGPPMPFGLFNTFSVPRQINTQGSYLLEQSSSALHDYNNFPGTISYPPVPYTPNETSYENFAQISGGDSEMSPQTTGTSVKEGFPNILGVFHIPSPLSRVESETTFKTIPGLFSAPSFHVTAGDFEQTHPGLFPPGVPIVSRVNIESRFPFVRNALPGPMSITSNLSDDFKANQWYNPDLPTEPVANLQNPFAWNSPPSFVQFPISKKENVKENVDDNPNNLPGLKSLTDMNPNQNIPNLFTHIPGQTFPSHSYPYNEGLMSEDAFNMSPLNSLMTEQSNDNKTISQMMPGLFPLRLPVPQDKNDIPDIPGSETIPDQPIPGAFPRPVQYPYLPLENYLNGPIYMNPNQNTPNVFPNILGLPFPNELYPYNEDVMSEDVSNMSPLNSLMTEQSNDNKTTSPIMPGLFPFPPFGMPLENHLNGPINMNPNQNIPNVFPNILGLPFPNDLYPYNDGPMSANLFKMSPLNSLMTEKRNDNKTTSQMMPGLFPFPPFGMPLENYLNGPINLNPNQNIFPNIPGLPFQSDLYPFTEGPILEDPFHISPLNSLKTEKRNDNKTTSQMMPGLFPFPPFGMPLENYLNGPINMNPNQNILSISPNIPGLPFPSQLDLNNEGLMSDNSFHNFPPFKSLMPEKHNDNKTTSQLMSALFQLPPSGISLETYSPIHPYGIGPWPLLPQGMFKYLDTLTPETPITPIQGMFPTFLPNLPIQLPPFNQPDLNQGITPSVKNPVVDSTTTATKTDPGKGDIISPSTPPTTMYITPSTTVVPPTTYVSPTTVTPPPPPTTTTTTSSPPSTAAPTTSTLPSTAAPTTTFIPSTVAPPKTTPVPTTTVAPTTKSLPPSTVAPLTSTSYAAAPAPAPSTTARTPPPTTLYTLLTSTSSLLSSTVTRNTTVSN